MTSVVFLVNGAPESAMGYRARGLRDAIGARADVEIAYRGEDRARAAHAFLGVLRRRRPALVYVLDLASSGVAAAAWFGATTGTPWAVDTGDAITALAHSMGTRGMLGVALTRALEDLALFDADAVVVRGTGHREWLAARGVNATVIPDGVWVDEFAGRGDPALRRSLGLDGAFTIGVLGNTVWNARLRWCYGWELLEVLRALPSRRVTGVMIGDGSGLPVLRARAAEYGVEDRIRFLGRVPYQDLPRYLGLMDVAISTQTNDLVGAVRTTGKIPLYLASGRYVLASAVGEAARVLPPEMLVRYDGVVDAAYPARLASRIAELLDDPRAVEGGEERIAIARRHFDYSVLGPRVLEVIERAAAR